MDITLNAWKDAYNKESTELVIRDNGDDQIIIIHDGTRIVCYRRELIKALKILEG